MLKGLRNTINKQHPSSLSAPYKLQVLGNHEVAVEGCKGVLRYEQEEICLNVGVGQLTFKGENLLIPVLERNVIQIEGCIHEISFL